MIYCYVGTKSRVIYVLEVFDDYASAKKELENIQKRYPEHKNISLKRGKFYYDLGVFGKVYKKSGLVKVVKDIAHAHVNLVHKDSEEFLINIKVRKVILNNKEKQQELFNAK